MPSVQQITFSGIRAARLGQSVLYVTERCVFELGAEGLKLVEVAPGIDPERDILDLMQVRPIIDEVRGMDPRIFRDQPMDIRTDLLHLDLDQRIAFDPPTGRLFINFEKMRVRTRGEVDRIARLVEKFARRSPGEWTSS